jgi:outer membrane receptor protein involved in Fe transport
MRRLGVLAALAWLLALPAFAQVNPTGALSGHVTDGANALPGVTVTAASPSAQGIRTALTSVSGDYLLAFLAPGVYTVRFELPGFQTFETTVKVNAAQTERLDAELPQAKVAEEVTVTGTYESVSTASQAATTVTADLLDKLPTNRDVTTAVVLTPATTQNGPRNAITISGGNSYDNLFMVNGVSVVENIRGTSIPLYIEDGVEETTTSISSIPAEYGRFAGGVVNTLTKSGGNEMHGSFRDTLNNDMWTAPTPLTTSRADRTTPSYEFTLGGYLLKDKLWFFGAGRYLKVEDNNYTSRSNLGIPHTLQDKRGEAKVTWSPDPDQRIIGSYINYRTDETGREFLPPADLETQIAPSVVNSLEAFNYTGVLSESFFVEGQYSYRRETFYDYGCPHIGDLIQGTVVYDYEYGTQANCSYFAANRGGPESRNSQDILAKGSWFVSTAGAGSHEIVFGLEQYRDMVKANNYQSASDFVVNSYGWYIDPTDPSVIYPRIYNVGYDTIEYWPIYAPAKMNNLQTGTAFVNDSWRLNENWSFNVGARYDRNHAVNADGAVTAKDSKLSPRLAVTFDPKGDSSWLLSASYGVYVGAQQQNFLNASSVGGAPNFFGWYYQGDPINRTCDPARPVETNCLTTEQALQKVFEWFDRYCDGSGNCGVNYPGGPAFYGANISYLTYQIDRNLASPSANEWTLSASKQLGSGGLVRFDYINRTYVDAYETQIDQSTGQVQDTLGNSYDVQRYVNAPSSLWKKYWAYILQFEYQPWGALEIGGNWTYSRAYGNLGPVETSGSGPTGNAFLSYPESKQMSWNSPVVDDPIDQRNRVTLWLVYDILHASHNHLSVSLLQSYVSGSPYYAVGGVRAWDYGQAALAYDSYVSHPLSTYYFTSSRPYHWDAQNRTDLGINYSFTFTGLGTSFEFFINPRITNVFNNQAVISGNTSVDDATTDPSLKAFDPFSEKPVEGINWRKGSLFGKPTGPRDYQTPRTYYITFGFRF